MYKINFCFLGLCCIATAANANNYGNTEPVINLNVIGDYEYNLHADITADRIIASTGHTTQVLAVQSLTGNNSTPKSWHDTVLYKYQLHWYSNLASIETNATLNLPAVSFSPPFTSSLPTSNNKYTIYKTNVDGIGVAFRVSALLKHPFTTYKDRTFNSGTTGLLQPRSNYLENLTGAVFLLAQAVLVKTKRTNFNQQFTNPVTIHLTLGQFEISAEQWQFAAPYKPLDEKIILPLTFNASLNIKPKTCTLASPAAQNVVLPRVANSYFNPTENSALIPSKEFSFNLENCEPNIKVYAALVDNYQPSNTTYVLSNKGSAANVGIELLKDNSAQRLSAASNSQMPDAYNASNKFLWQPPYTLTARYKKIDANTDVGAGTVQSQLKVYFYYK